MKESDIIHENGLFWVGRRKNWHTVYQIKGTHSVGVVTYGADFLGDGKDAAIKTCDALAAGKCKGLLCR